MTATTASIDALTCAIATALAPARQGMRRAFAWRMPPELWVALMLAIAAATAPAQARAETAAAAIAEGELDTVASVTLGGTRYELTNFTCARAAQLQAEGETSKRARAYGQWLAQQPAGLKSMTLRLDNGASDGAGCYERIPGGIRVYVQGRAQPRDVIAPIVPGDPSAAGGAYDSPAAAMRPAVPAPTATRAPAATRIPAAARIRTDAVDDFIVLSERCLRSGSPADGTCLQRDALESRVRFGGYVPNSYDGMMSPDRIAEFERVVRANRTAQFGPPPIRPWPLPTYPHTSTLSDRLMQHLAGGPPGMRADFQMDERPATMWRFTCKQIADLVSKVPNNERDRAFVDWLSTSPGRLLTVLRIDGSTALNCFAQTGSGLLVYVKGQQPLEVSLR
ncbi:hypothetical protein [Variovorax gossypii]